jgi:hypothetical protein
MICSEWDHPALWKRGAPRKPGRSLGRGGFWSPRRRLPRPALPGAPLPAGISDRLFPPNPLHTRPRQRMASVGGPRGGSRPWHTLVGRRGYGYGRAVFEGSERVSGIEALLLGIDPSRSSSLPSVRLPSDTVALCPTLAALPRSPGRWASPVKNTTQTRKYASITRHEVTAQGGFEYQRYRLILRNPPGR